MPSADAVFDSTSDCSEWWLYWTTRGVHVPAGFDDVLDGWVDIDARERALGVEEATPILIDPAGRIDPRLAKFFRRSRFSFLAEGTRQSYVKDYRLFFTFLWRRGKYWDQADYDDVDDYEAWRRRSADNPRPVGGAKWARELAAFRLLFDWAVVSGAVKRSPVATHTVRRRDGTVVEVAANRPRDIRVANVKWVTPRTYRLWRDIGLRGYSGDGLPEPGWRGRNNGRDGLNRNKRNISVDLRIEEGQQLLRRMLAEADVVIENFKAGTLERWGLGDDVLAAEFPRLVHCRITGYGTDGPLGGAPGYDAVLQALSGLMSINGETRRSHQCCGNGAVGVAVLDSEISAVWILKVCGRQPKSGPTTNKSVIVTD